MPLPIPHPGLVVGYAYLWREEYAAGRTEGAKDRPCAIVLTTEDDAGDTIVTVVPVTHSIPNDPSSAVELPDATRRRLGLDSERSWVIVSEVNRFVWPGPDLRPVSRREPDRFHYGVLPPTLFKRITTRLLEQAARQRMAVVPRET